MICKTFILGCIVCLLGMVLSILVLAIAQKQNKTWLFVTGIVLVLATCFGTLGIGMVQKAETNRVSDYAHVWQKQLFSDIVKADTRAEADEIVAQDLAEYEKGYEAQDFDDDRIAPQHRRPHPQVSLESGAWKKGEPVKVFIEYNDEARPYSKTLTIQ